MKERQPFGHENIVPGSNSIPMATSFRSQELERRKARNIALAKNAAALAVEPLTEFDKAVQRRVEVEAKERALRLEKELSPGYWQRLWRALLNR